MADSNKLLLYGSSGAGAWYYFKLEQVSQNYEANTSKIRLTHIAYTDGNWGAYDIPTYTYITPTVDGSVKSRTQITNAPYISIGSSAIILTQEFTVAHNAEGKKTVSVSCYFDDTVGGGGATGRVSASLELDRIPRASSATLDKTSLTADGSSVTLTINKSVSSFTSTLTWKYGTKTGVLLEKSSAASKAFAPDPADLYSEGLSGKLYFYLSTFSGNTQMGDTKEYSVDLTIPAVSTVKGIDANIGANTILTVTRNSKAYTHSMYYVFSTLSQYIKADGNAQDAEVKYENTSVPFTIPVSFYQKLTNGKTAKVTVYIKTYYGSKQVGSTQSSQFTVTATGDPTITNVSVVDQNSTTIALTGNSARQVRFFSKPKISFSATAKNYASVADTSIGGVSAGATNTPSRTIDVYAGEEISLAVKDSRGYITTDKVTPSIVEYVMLTTNHRVYRPQPTNGTAQIVFTGMYWSGNFGQVQNTLTLKYRYKPVGGSYSSWVNVTPNISGGMYSATVNLTGFDYKTAYQFQLSIEDKLCSFTPEDKSTYLREGMTVADWGKKDFNINVPLTIEGHSTPIGDIITKTANMTTSVAVTANVPTQICSITLPPGKWLVFACWNVNEKAAMHYGVGFSGLFAPMSYGNSHYKASGYSGVATTGKPLEVTRETTVTLFAWATVSVSAANNNAVISAMRVA